MVANGTQDRRPVDRVGFVGDVNREGNITRIRAEEPLARSVNDCLASVGCLETELEGLEDHAGALGDEVHSDLTREAADGFACGDRP